MVGTHYKALPSSPRHLSQPRQTSQIIDFCSNQNVKQMGDGNMSHYLFLKIKGKTVEKVENGLIWDIIIKIASTRIFVTSPNTASNTDSGVWLCQSWISILSTRSLRQQNASMGLSDVLVSSGLDLMGLDKQSNFKEKFSYFYLETRTSSLYNLSRKMFRFSYVRNKMFIQQ